MECYNCGMICDLDMEYCPKCDTRLRDQFVDELIIIDIAHNGENWEYARTKIDKALDEAFLFNMKGLKIIHGRGRDSGHTRIIANNTIKYLKMLARQHGGKVVQDRHTDGAHLLYFNF